MTKKEAKELEILVPDTSVLIEGLVSKKIAEGSLKPQRVIVHEAVVAELEHQANQNKAKGFLGLDELDELRELTGKHGFNLEFSGRKPGPVEIRHARLGEIDAMIRDLAYELGATLFTSDKVQARIAKAKGMNYLFFEIEPKPRKFKLESFFDSTTMSVHLRENILAKAKKGVPGSWKFVSVSKEPITRDEIQDISKEIIEETGIRRDAFVEIERPGSTIVQLGPYRIVITKPPFSDGWEITAVRPVKKLSLDDYGLSEKLKQRVSEQAEGILIAGAPGMGKSTFAQALAEHYASQDKIVKTIEAPRDLILGDNITQYATSHGDAQEIHDILLLSRPDNTVFDEMRNTNDFKLFADLRLSGIGLAGVVHATNPIDAVQRFVGRIELGVIPHVIDTVIFIKNGKVDKVLSLKMTVKVPSGMTEDDLARPVVVVEDFETGKLVFELYSYGEETVVIPISETKSGSTPSRNLAAEKIKDEFRKYSRDVSVEMVSDHKAIVRVPESDIAKIIGKQGKTINEIEKTLGIGIDVQEKSGKGGKGFSREASDGIAFHSEITNKHILLTVDKEFIDRNVSIILDGDYLLTAHVSKEGTVRIKKKNKIGKILANAINAGEKVQVAVQ